MNKKIKRRLLLAGLFAWPATLLAGGKLLGRRLKRRCTLPDYNYAADRAGNPVSGTTTKGIAWLVDGSLAVTDVAVPKESREVLKTFQLDQSALQIDHCRISRVVITITSDGFWTLNLTAQQDPALVQNPALRPQFERYRRNRFRVDVRPVGLMDLNAEVDLAKVAKPEFPFIDPQEFWVQKGQVLRIRRREYSADLQRYFYVIRQAEVHFSYVP